MKFYCNNGKWQDGSGGDVKTAPMQRVNSWTGDGRIPYEWAEEAYKEYSAQYGTSQTLERMNERGGFGSEEIIGLLVDRIKRLEPAPAPLSPVAGPREILDLLDICKRLLSLERTAKFYDDLDNTELWEELRRCVKASDPGMHHLPTGTTPPIPDKPDK